MAARVLARTQGLVFDNANLTLHRIIAPCDLHPNANSTWPRPTRFLCTYTLYAWHAHRLSVKTYPVFTITYLALVTCMHLKDLQGVSNPGIT